MDLVVNEWLPEYFLPGAMPDHQAMLKHFIQRFLARRDRLVVLNPSPFTAKLYSFAKQYAANRTVYEPIKLFINTIILNPACTTLVSITDPLPAETLATLHEQGTNYSSDEYLFYAALRTETKMILTTDEKLFRAMEQDPVFKVRLLKDFLANY